MKLLIVTETASIHAARWVNQLKDTGWDVHVFQALSTSGAVNEEFRFGNLHIPTNANVADNLKCYTTIFPERRNWLVEHEKKYPGLIQYLHEQYLLKLLNEWQPDIIHSLGLNINWNNICLPVLRVLNNNELKQKPRWLYSTWGTDLAFFAKISKQNYANVENVLKNVDYLVTECERDFRLSKEMGFKGKFLGYFTGFGGVSTKLLDRISETPKASSRKTILLKGRSIEDGDPVGRAMTAIRAFKLCEELLRDYRIVISAAASSFNMANEVELLRATTNLKIQILPYLPYDMLMDIYASARLYISLTVNDGIPSGILEAMSAGTFPIHSDLEPIREMITDGTSGMLVDPENVMAVADALRVSLKDDHLVDYAESINKKTIQEKFSERVVKPRVVRMYESLILEDKPKQYSAINDTMPDEIMYHNNIPVFEIISKAVNINNERVYGMVSRAIDINNERVYGMVSGAMAINNEKLNNLVLFAMRIRKFPLRLLNLIMKVLKKL